MRALCGSTAMGTRGIFPRGPLLMPPLWADAGGSARGREALHERERLVRGLLPASSIVSAWPRPSPSDLGDGFVVLSGLEVAESAASKIAAQRSQLLGSSQRPCTNTTGWRAVSLACVTYSYSWSEIVVQGWPLAGPFRLTKVLTLERAVRHC